MKNYIKSLAISLAAICVLLILAVPAFAEAGNGYYVVGTPTTYSTSDTINVKLVIQSRAYAQNDNEIINTVEDVTLTGYTSYTVLDVLRAYNNMQTDIEIRNTSGNPLATTDTFISAITKIKTPPDTDKSYSYLFFADIGNGEGRIPVDGWMCRVNGLYPMLNTTGFNGGPEGALIHQTPVADGDVVTLYTSCPFKISGTNYCSTFVSADVTQSGSDYGVQLRNCNENHYDTNQSGQWTFSLSNCTYFVNNDRTGTLYDANWNTVATLNFSSTGYATLPSTLPSGTYYLYVPSTQRWISRQAYAWFTGTNKVTCNVLRATMVFDRIVK